MAKNSDFLPIEDYYLIGDLRTAALISKLGSIDWLCLPFFDSPSVFSKLLDQDAGRLAIDMPDYQISSRYVEDTAIVEFKLARGDAEFSIRDFMVPKATKKAVPQQLVRAISGIKGKTDVNIVFQPKPNFASATLSAQMKDKTIEISLNEGLLVLRLPNNCVIDKKKDHYHISIPIKAAETKYLVLEYIPKNQKSASRPASLEAKALNFWQEWVKKGSYFDFCRSHLVRSAITLKLMQFYPTGAMVAAPTTSLPETLGGVRNWDYRYTWIRDATFTLYSLYALGYSEEAEAFFNFIEMVSEKCAEEKFDVSLMYTIWGEPVPKEKVISKLSGYKNSAPVRIGNDAAQQFQLDVYGALIDAFYFVSKHKLTASHKQKWRPLVMQLVRKIDQSWQKPDHGIWEARIGTKHYTYSKVMAWVGADRANRLRKTLNLSPDELKICTSLEKRIKQWIWDNSFKDNKFFQHAQTEAADATTLLFVLLQFLDKHQPLTRKIIKNTTRELTHHKAFVYRYLNPDGLPGEEGAFILCSFWLISALAILEDVESALGLFKQLEKYVNPQGLLSEEIDAKTKEYLGNYPQAFSHMGYIMSAHYIHKYAKRKNIKI